MLTEHCKTLLLPPIRTLLNPMAPSNIQLQTYEGQDSGYPTALEVLAKLKKTDSNFITSSPESANHTAKEIESLVGHAIQVLARNNPEASRRLLIDILSELIIPNTGKQRLRAPSMAKLNPQPPLKRPKSHQEGCATEVSLLSSL
ncbi:hypothetical protein AX14_003213 [Amanita brunnescens Koide BX004]|nr:hypothetical protein AX14_003213 [Amanita brunnescens Koide BX004]